MLGPEIAESSTTLAKPGERERLRVVQIPAAEAKAVADDHPQVKPVERRAGFAGERHAQRHGARVEQRTDSPTVVVGAGPQQHPAEVRGAQHDGPEHQGHDGELAVVEDPVPEKCHHEVQFDQPHQNEPQLRLLELQRVRFARGG